jgi:glycerophosphoryl diester phosphodiesterase
MVMHDASVDRTTDGTGAFSSKTMAELKQLDAGSWFAADFTGERVPTFEESMNAILPAAVPLIEHKTGTAAAYVAELRRLNIVSNVVVQSFDWSFVSAVHALEPGIRLAALGSGTLTRDKIMSMMNAGVETVAWEKSSIGEAELAMVHAVGLKLFVWTVDGAEIARFVDLGVDGIISNDPGRVKAISNPTVPVAGDLARGLVAYWPMDDGVKDPSSRVLIDRCGTNDGALTVKSGSVPWLTGDGAKFAGGLRVEGNNVYAQIANSPELNIPTNAVTVSLWVRLETLPSGIAEAYGGIFDSVQDCYALYLDRSGQELKFKVSTRDGDAARPGISQAALTTNEWLHVVGTYRGSEGLVSGQASVFLNGVPQDVHSGSDSSSAVGLTGTVKAGQIAALGRNGTQSVYPFSGGLDDLAVWSRALSEAEVKLLYQRGCGGESLGDLIRVPTVEISIGSAVVSGQTLRIQFQNGGNWSTLKLLRATAFEGPFIAVPALEPVQLGGASYQFSYPLNGTQKQEFFRIGGE